MATTHAQRRLTKHELKQDAFTTAMFSAREWLENNMRMAVLVVGGLIVIVAAIWGFFAWQSSERLEARKLFGQAGVEMRSGNPTAAIAQLQKLLDEHSGADVAGAGCFQLAQLQFRQRAFDDARVNYQRYIDDYGDDQMLVAASYAGMAAVDEQAGFYAEALEKFMRAVDADKEGFAATDYLRRAIRCAIAGSDTAKAQELYDRLTKDYPKDAASINTAKQMLLERGMLDPAKL
jgi:tetratricopeptide (TPR) repeat protein